MIAWKRVHLGDRHDVLSMVIGAHDEDGTMLSDDDLVAQANLLTVVGHETSADGL
jgi:cytochrome P450